MTSPLMETPPKWHGLVAWVVACLVASSLILAYMVVDTWGSGSILSTQKDKWQGYIVFWGVSTFTGMVLVAAPSFLLVWMIRGAKWRRGMADVLAGFALGFAFPMLTLLMPNPRPGQVFLAAMLFGLFGALTGFAYWAVARWLAGRWVKRERARELEVF